MRLLPFLILLGSVFVAACEPTIANRGNILDPDKVTEVKVGTSSREDVANTLGTPTHTSTFDDKTWYYIGRKTQQFSFYDPEVIEQKTIVVHFDDLGIVTAVNDLDMSTAEDIKPVDRRTPTYGNDNTLIQQLLGNLSNPRPATKKQQGQ
jgi:hypothetical protein